MIVIFFHLYCYINIGEATEDMLGHEKRLSGSETQPRLFNPPQILSLSLSKDLQHGSPLCLLALVTSLFCDWGGEKKKKSKQR